MGHRYYVVSNISGIRNNPNSIFAYCEKLLQGKLWTLWFFYLLDP